MINRKENGIELTTGKEGEKILRVDTPETLEEVLDTQRGYLVMSDKDSRELLNHAIEGKDYKDPLKFRDDIINSHCPYTEFEREKEKIKKPFRESVADMLADYIFYKRGLDIEKKVRALEKLEKSLNFDDYGSSDKEQLKTEMERLYGEYSDKAEIIA